MLLLTMSRTVCTQMLHLVYTQYRRKCGTSIRTHNPLAQYSSVLIFSQPSPDTEYVKYLWARTSSSFLGNTDPIRSLAL